MKNDLLCSNLAAKIYSSGNDLLVTRADDDSGIKYRLISSKSGLKLNKYVNDVGSTLWEAATTADLNTKIQQVKFTMPSSANDAYNIALSTLGVKYTDISKVILAGIIVRNATNNLFYQLPNGLGDYTCAGIQYLHMRIKLKQSDVEFYGRQEGIATFIVM